MKEKKPPVTWKIKTLNMIILCVLSSESPANKIKQNSKEIGKEKERFIAPFSYISDFGEREIDG